MEEHKVIIVTLLGLFLFSSISFSNACISDKIGINYGRLGSNLPSFNESIEYITSMKAGRLKIYDANPEILGLLSGTKLQVSIMVSNGEISTIASNQTKANQWVSDNVLAFYPKTMIRFILVGNEILSLNSSDEDRRIWNDLVPAMQKIHNALKAEQIRNIKVGTPLAMDILESTFPPSSATFREDIPKDQVMLSLLRFLRGTNSFFFLDVYPYFSWSADPRDMNLDFALLRDGAPPYTDPRSGLKYSNLLDQMLDSVVFAMSKLGFDNVQLAIAETGWPNSGDIDQPGANIHNAATYNRNLVKKMRTQPSLGTPARPGVVIPTFIFSLYDEDQKGGPGTERHWGLLDNNGRPIYELDLSRKRSESDYGHLPLPLNDEPYKGNIWCVASKQAKPADLAAALVFACSHGNGTCDAIARGNKCHEPVSMYDHASYAFSSYWAKFRGSGAKCHFDGVAVQTTKDPSHGTCKFPNVSLDG